MSIISKLFEFIIVAVMCLGIIGIMLLVFSPFIALGIGSIRLILWCLWG